MIDRDARNRMASALRSYMNEEITAFDLDEAMYEIADDTEDQTVEHVGNLLWYLYDDLKDHKIVATKEEWKYLRRLLLLLESNAEIVKQKSKWHWSFQQLLAAACFAVLGVIAWKYGRGIHLLLASIPLGIISIRMARWPVHERTREEELQEKKENALLPFPSISSLLAVRRRVPHFAKQPYPRSVSDRRVREGLSLAITQLYSSISLLVCAATWLAFAPLPLFFQMFPRREGRIAIKVSGEAAHC